MREPAHLLGHEEGTRVQQDVDYRDTGSDSSFQQQESKELLRNKRKQHLLDVNKERF